MRLRKRPSSMVCFDGTRCMPQFCLINREKRLNSSGESSALYMLSMIAALLLFGMQTLNSPPWLVLQFLA